MKRHPMGLVTIALLLAACTASSDNAQPEEATTSTSTGTAPIETIETPRGSVTIELGDDTYETDINNCTVDADTDTVQILGTGQRDGVPIRIEYGANTDRQLGLFINTASPIDPGTTSWIGRPNLTITNTTATATGIDMTETNTGDTATATATVACTEP